MIYSRPAGGPSTDQAATSNPDGAERPLAVPQRRRPQSASSRAPGPLGSGLRLGVQWPATGVVLVRIGGEVDLAAVPRINELIRQRLTAATLYAVVLDLSDVVFVSSSGIEQLLHAQNRADQRGIEFYVVVESAPVQRLLNLIGVADYFERRVSVAEAVAEARTHC